MTDKRAEEIGMRIRKLRKEAGLTQESLGKKAGIEANTIARAERGVHRASSDTIEKLAKALDTTVTQILGV